MMKIIGTVLLATLCIFFVGCEQDAGSLEELASIIDNSDDKEVYLHAHVLGNIYTVSENYQIRDGDMLKIAEMIAAEGEQYSPDVKCNVYYIASKGGRTDLDPLLRNRLGDRTIQVLLRDQHFSSLLPADAPTRDVSHYSNEDRLKYIKTEMKLTGVIINLLASITYYIDDYEKELLEK